MIITFKIKLRLHACTEIAYILRRVTMLIIIIM